jgi:hypothetical protein
MRHALAQGLVRLGPGYFEAWLEAWRPELRSGGCGGSLSIS